MMSILERFIAYKKKIKKSKERNKEELKRRLIESEKLSPEFDYLKINDKGRLIKKYPIPMSMSFTYDKVAAAGFIRGFQLMDENPELGWAAAYIGINEIQVRAGREPIFTEEQIEECKKQALERRE